MRFWDSSALVPLFVPEETTRRLAKLVREDTALVVWWGTTVECTSAIARLERDGDLTAAEVKLGLDRMRAAAAGWLEVPPTDSIRRQAMRLLRVHPLRAADAIQLAAALVAADSAPSSLELVTLDHRLGDAAEREGFPVPAV